MVEDKNTASAANIGDKGTLLSFPAMMWRFRLITQMEIETAIPAMILKYDRMKHKAYVQILVKDKTNIGDYAEEKPFWINVRRIQCGGFLVDIPYYEGDVGWVIAGAKNTDKVKLANVSVQAKDTGIGKESDGNIGAQPQNNDLIHKYDNGFFIPDSWANIKLYEEDENLTQETNLANAEHVQGGMSSYEDCMVIQRIGHDKKAITTIALTKEGDVAVESATGIITYNGRGIWPDNTSAFAYYNGAFHNCAFQYGRSFYQISNYTDKDGTIFESENSGLYYLYIPSEDPSKAEIRIGETLCPPSTLTYTTIPLARIYNDMMVSDFRGCPCVPVYEDGNYQMDLPPTEVFSRRQFEK